MKKELKEIVGVMKDGLDSLGGDKKCPVLNMNPRLTCKFCIQKDTCKETK